MEHLHENSRFAFVRTPQHSVIYRRERINAFHNLSDHFLMLNDGSEYAS